MIVSAFGLGLGRTTGTQLGELARPPWVADGLVGGAVAALLSGIPSTAHALVSGRSLAESSLAAGSLLLPRERRTHRLILAAVPVHLGLSVGWGFVLAVMLPRRRTVVVGAAAGATIAALDFGLVGRRFRRLRELPLLPQLADHAAYGAIVAAVVAHRRARRASAADV